jgi:hypothetical protein
MASPPISPQATSGVRETIVSKLIDAQKAVDAWLPAVSSFSIVVSLMSIPGGEVGARVAELQVLALARAVHLRERILLRRTATTAGTTLRPAAVQCALRGVAGDQLAGRGLRAS